jgi:transaldolase
MLDSASVRDAAAASQLGFISAITTNPTLIARENRPSVEIIRSLLDVFDGPILFQSRLAAAELARREIDDVLDLAPQRIVPKVPARVDFAALAAGYARDGHTVALTSVYAREQAVLASAAGIDWVIPYVDRARRLLEDGERLVGDLATLLARAGGTTRILAASIKSPGDVVGAVLDGAAGVTAPLDVLVRLGDNPHTEAAIEEFTGR